MIRRNPLLMWTFAWVLVTMILSTRAPASDIKAVDHPADASQVGDVVGLLEEILVELKLLNVELLEHRVELREEKIAQLEERLGRVDSRRAEIEARDREAGDRLQQFEQEESGFHALVATHEINAAREKLSALDREEEQIDELLNQAVSDHRRFLARLTKLHAELEAEGQ